MLGRYLLCKILLILLELSKASFINEANFLLAAILSNLLVEIPKPEHDARLMQNTLLIDALVVVLVLVKSTKHRGVHLLWRNWELIRLL